MLPSYLSHLNFENTNRVQGTLNVMATISFEPQFTENAVCSSNGNMIFAQFF